WFVSAAAKTNQRVRGMRDLPCENAIHHKGRDTQSAGKRKAPDGAAPLCRQTASCYTYHRFSKQAQRSKEATSVSQAPSVRLSGIDWQTYTRLLRAFAERPGIRLAYDRGELEIVA